MPGHIRISLTVERDTVVRALPGFERAFAKPGLSAAPRLTALLSERRL